MKNNDLPSVIGAEALALCGQNELLGRYGLSLSGAQAETLVRHEGEVLMENGRIAFGEGVLKKLLYALCDSPWLDQQNLTEVLCEMTDTFYYYKNESDGILSDDELIEAMMDYFNGKAQGSMAYMTETSLGDMMRTLKRGGNWGSDDSE